MFIKLEIVLNLLLIPLEVYSVGIHTFRKDWTFEEKEVILSRDLTLRDVNTVGDNLFLYGICDETINNSKKLCDLVLETYTSEDLIYISTCRLHMETGSDNRMIVRNFILSQMGSEKAVFMWLERDVHEVTLNEVLLKIRVVNFANCDFNDIKIPIEIQSGLVNDIAFNNVLVYEDTFDVIFYSKNMCITGRCKVTYDAEGRRLGNIEPFPATNYTTLSWIFPVSNSLPRRYFVFIWVFGKLSMSLVDSNGEERNLLSRQFESYITFGASYKNETVGLCWLPMRGSSTVTCTQIDWQGNIKMNVTLNFGYKIINVKTINLDDGGLLLLQLICMDEKCLGYKTFYVSRIYSDGHHCNKPLELPGITVDAAYLDRYRIGFYKKNEDEFCMSFAGPMTISEFDITEKSPRLTFISKCFHKKYVIVK